LNGDLSSSRPQVENTLSTYDPHGIVVVYSVVDRASLGAAEDVLGYLWRMGFGGRNTLILVGNKARTRGILP